MKTFPFTGPDNKTYEIQGPDNATPEQAFQMLLRVKPELANVQPPPKGTIPNPNQAEYETLAGTSDLPQGVLFKQQQQIEARLRSAGKSDEEIENDPEWQKASKNLARSVSASQGQMALGAAAGDLLPVGQGISALASKGASVVRGAIQGTKPVLAAIKDVGATSEPSALGQKMFGRLRQRVDTLLQDRRAAEKELRAKYLSEGVAKEGEIVNQYNDVLNEKFVQNSHPLVRKVIEDSGKNVQGVPSIETLVIERRNLMDMAGGKWQGVGAVQQSIARDLAKSLTDIIKKEVPSYEEYLGAYAKKSEPIDLFEHTAFGKRVTSEASEFLPDVPGFDVKDLPKNAFKSKQSLDILRKVSGNDDKFVRNAASEHVASGLKDLSATEARQWLTKNNDWLEEIPEVKAQAERYVKNLEEVSHTTERSRRLLKEVGKSVGYGGATYFGLHELGLAR